MNGKKFHYIKIKDEPKKKRDPRKKQRVMKNIGHALTVVGTTLSSMLLIIVVMLCIVVTVVVVYILNFADNGFDANLRDTEMKYTSMIYAYDSEGHEVEITRLAAEQNRIWVNYEDISPHLINAIVSTEDKRFWDHKGVDWRRTVFALGADVLNLSRAGQGGSTITQQLVKNITGDDSKTWERKLREIFRAMSLEEKYTKIDILESYLNRIWLGGMVYGVGAASQYYFGKDAKDLDIAESAIIAGMIRNPYMRSPYIDLQNCKDNQIYALTNMYEQGYISLREYEDAKVEQVKFARTVYGDAFGYVDPNSLEPEKTDEEKPDEEDIDDEEYEAYKWNEYEISQNWYVDAAIDQVINDYAELKGVSYTSARNEIYNGGYKIYINMDIELQNKLEEKYRDPLIAMTKYDKTAKEDDLLQSAFVITNYEGTVVALAGGLGDKPGDNCFNRATMAVRAPGSTIKPIAVYSTAIQNNIVTYSTMFPDKQISIIGENYEIEKWPFNFDSIQTGELMPVWMGLRESKNTLSVRITQLLTPQVCYNQLTENLGLTTIADSDIALSPMSMGALTNGAKLYEMAAAYQIFGNGGIYYRPMLYSRVVDSKDNVILKQDFYGTQAIDSDTAWIVNRMMKTVVTDGTSSGANAALPNCEVIGKTGTSNSGKDLLFAGCTPEYVGMVWLGYDNNKDIPTYSWSPNWDFHRYCAQIWHDVMIDIVDTSQTHKFTPDSSVLERRYCVQTGLLASTNCDETKIGYYRDGNLPGYCSGNHEEELEALNKKWEDYDLKNEELVKEELANYY